MLKIFKYPSAYANSWYLFDYLSYIPHHQFSFLQAMPACLRPNHRPEDQWRLRTETPPLVSIILCCNIVCFTLFPPRDPIISYIGIESSFSWAFRRTTCHSWESSAPVWVFILHEIESVSLSQCIKNNQDAHFCNSKGQRQKRWAFVPNKFWANYVIRSFLPMDFFLLYISLIKNISHHKEVKSAQK